MAKKEIKKPTSVKKSFVKKQEEKIKPIKESEMEAAIEEDIDDEGTIEDEPMVSVKEELENTINEEPSEVEEKKEEEVAVDVMNGDPSVITLVDEIHETAMNETFKENKTSRIDNTIGYSWNGMEMDW